MAKRGRPKKFTTLMSAKPAATPALPAASKVKRGKKAGTPKSRLAGVRL